MILGDYEMVHGKGVLKVRIDQDGASGFQYRTGRYNGT